jgi:TPR repeat protein
MVGLTGVMSSDRGTRPRSGEQQSGVCTKGFSFARAGRSLVASCALAAVIILCVDSATPIFADYADGYRTEQATALPDAVKLWRQDAWRLDDFYAQVRLGDLYWQNQSFAPKESSKNPSFFDPVEAYVWYFMALRPDHVYSFDDNAAAYQSLAATRSSAQRNMQDVYDNLTFEQRLEARARILYILSSRGAEGFITLGRLHGVGIAQPGPYTPYSPYTSKIQLCMRSDFTYWPLSWFYYLYASVRGGEYPHRPVWKWVENNNKNLSQAFPDSDCVWLDRTPPPDDVLRQQTSYPANGPVPLSGAPSGATGLPISPPNAALSADPRAALQGGPGSVGIDSGPVPLTAQDPSAAMSPPAGAYSGYGGYGGASPYGAGGSYAGSGGSGGGYAGTGGGGYAGNGFGGGYGYGYGGGYGSYSYGPQIPSVFVQNDAEALTYFQRADILGHPLADSYTASLRYSISAYNPDGKKIIAEAEKRARYWAPPYEFYPGATTGGIPHSDESLPNLEQRIAYGRIDRLPPFAIAEALDFRRYTIRGRGCGPPPLCVRKSIMQYQSAMGWEPTGFLTPPQVVRLIQMAAVDGDAVAQDRLGIMYAKGIGVPQNFVRAEKWFINSANQHNADALYNLYVLYKVGPNGIEQDEHRAASFFLQASAARYNVLLCELQDLLKQADDRHDHPDGPRR